jgi:hypothetical protein
LDIKEITRTINITYRVIQTFSKIPSNFTNSSECKK